MSARKGKQRKIENVKGKKSFKQKEIHIRR